MTILRFHTQLLTLIASLTLSAYVNAEDSAQNENKYNRASNTLSDADNTDHVGSNAHPALESTHNIELISPGSAIEDRSSAEEMYLQQREALRQYLDNRQRQMWSAPGEPMDAESRRSQFIKDIEQRRLLIDKMYEYRRKAIEERRQQRLLEMHRTGNDTPTDINNS